MKKEEDRVCKFLLCNYYYIMNSEEKGEIKYSAYGSKYIMIWLFFILIFTCIFVFILILGNYNSPYLTRDNLLDYRILSSLAPKYPPPLFNFMN